MTKNQYRFFIEPKNLQADRVKINDKDLIHQINKVLRLNTGDQIILLDNSGFEYLVNLEKNGQEVEGKIIKKTKNENEPNKKIILCQSLLKNDHFEQVLKFGTNLGISKFIPIISQRSIIKEINSSRKQRFQSIIREAAEQSCRGILSELSAPIFIENLREEIKNQPGFKLIAWEEEKNKTIKDFQSQIRDSQNIYILIGPEGGFDQSELILAKEIGFESFSLGKLILRSEIAGLVASVLALN